MELLVAFWTILLFILGAGQEVSSASCPYFSATGHYVIMTCPSGCCGTKAARYCCGHHNVGLIVGCVVGGLTILGLIIGIILCCYCGVCACYTTRVLSSSSSSAAVPNYKSTAALP